MTKISVNKYVCKLYHFAPLKVKVSIIMSKLTEGVFMNKLKVKGYLQNKSRIWGKIYNFVWGK